MSNTTLTPGAAAIAVPGNQLAVASFAAGIATLVWSLLQGAVGAPAPPMQFMQAQFVVSGTLGSGGVLQIQGSADGANWSTLGGMTSLTAAGYSSFSSVAGDAVVTPLPNGKLLVSITDGSLAEPLRYLRPVIVGGDGTTNVAVTGKVSSVGAV